MADNNTINVQISAQTKELEAGLKKAGYELVKFEGGTIKLQKTTEQFSKTVKTNAVPAITSFSQVIQDAPYGIRGVANNITQLTSQFGYLSKSTGGAGNALKAMLGTLTGPAGILLAVSVVTSLLVKYEEKLLKSSTEAEKLAKAQEDLVKSLDDYKKGLDAVSLANLNGSQNAVKELTNLRLLKAQIDNTNLSNRDRIKAVEELQRKYPSYLGNISNEDALVGGLDTKYDELTTAILKTAKAQAGAKLISESYQKILVLEQKLAEQTNDLGQKAIANQNANNELKKKGALISASEAEYAQRTSKRYEEALALTTQTAKEINNLNADINNLQKSIEENGGIVPLNFDTKKVESDFINFRGFLAKESIFYPTIVRQGLSNVVSEFALFSESLQVPIAAAKAELTDMELALIDFNNRASSIINNSIANTFADLGSAIGEALANSGNILEAGGLALLSGLGSILVQLGEMAIGVGVGLLGIKTALETLNPFVAIAAGVALVALGSIVSSATKKIGGGIGGSTSSVSGTGSSAPSYSTNTSTSSSGFGGGGTVVFEIAGTKLVGVLNRTLERNRALGGSNLAFST